jgi:uncharacterized protein DUF6602
MNNLKFKNRRKMPVEVFESGFKAALHEFIAEFLKSADFQHALSKGEEREIPIQRFFRDHLPEAFGVAKGEAVDIGGRRGPQLDVMIFNKTRNFAFYNGALKILPAEALLVSIEVKSSLTKSELESSLGAAKRLNELRPFGRHLSARRRGGKPADEKARFFHCIFAYGSDLKAEGWLEQEYLRLSGVARDLRAQEGLIDRIYVLNRGLINTTAQTGVTEQPHEGTALMQFYMHILNFLARENERRESVPYLEYAGRMAGGWRSLKTF